jgi:hypothetical protein
MGAAVIPYAFAGRIGIDFGIFDFDFGILGSWRFWTSIFLLVYFPPGASGELVVSPVQGPGTCRVVFEQLEEFLDPALC